MFVTFGGPAQKVKIVFPCERELSFRVRGCHNFNNLGDFFRHVFQNAFQDTFLKLLDRFWYKFGLHLVTILALFCYPLFHACPGGAPPDSADTPPPLFGRARSLPMGGAYPVLNLYYGEPGNQKRRTPKWPEASVLP